jgi:hypothetical protein
VFARIFETLAADADNEFMMIDATIVRAHQHSAGVQKRRRESSHRPFPRRPDDKDPRRRRCTRQPGRAVADAGQAADITQAAPLLDEVEPDAFIGDKGYDSDALVEKLEQRGITPVIPPKANRS